MTRTEEALQHVQILLNLLKKNLQAPDEMPNIALYWIATAVVVRRRLMLVEQLLQQDQNQSDPVFATDPPPAQSIFKN